MSRSGSHGAGVEAIVVGASAGGIDAMSVVLPAISEVFAGAVFAVLHLPRERPSLLVEIFAPKCRLAVREAEDKEPIDARTIYFAPPDYHMLVDRGPALALSADPPVHFSRPSIDVLFESAADVYGPRLMGVLLTGANEDGAAGLEAVHRAGGVTCVEDPATAAVPFMAAAALRRWPGHRVLSLPALADWLSAVTAGNPA